MDSGAPGMVTGAPQSDSATRTSADCAHREGTLGQEGVRALRGRAANGARHGTHRHAPGERRVDGVTGAAAGPALDDDHDVAQRGEETVARREPPLLGADSGGRFGDDRAMLGHTCPEPGMTPRVGIVEAARHHCDRRRARGARPLVRRTVDPEGQPGDRR